MDAKVEKLKAIIKQAGRVAVAFSGGVDSSFLTRVAAAVLPPADLLAVMVNSCLQPPGELENARAVAARIGCRLQIRAVDPLAWPEFVANPPDRCYHCKKKIYLLVGDLLAGQPGMILMDGTNLDDLDEDRPGRRAIAELGIKTPLVEAGLRKAEIRQISRRLQLDNWNRPSSSCLATRIPSGLTVTGARLNLVRQSEQYLHSRGFYGCRARLADKAIHLELAEADVERFAEAANRAAAGRFFRDLGVAKVYVDIKGR